MGGSLEIRQEPRSSNRATALKVGLVVASLAYGVAVQDFNPMPTVVVGALAIAGIVWLGRGLQGSLIATIGDDGVVFHGGPEPVVVPWAEITEIRIDRGVGGAVKLHRGHARTGWVRISTRGMTADADAIERVMRTHAGGHGIPVEPALGPQVPRPAS